MAARYSVRCSSRTRSCSAVLAITALACPSLHPNAQTKQRPFPHRRLCCPPGSSGTTAASDTHPARHPLPGETGYRTRRSDGITRRPPGRGGPPQFPPPPSERSAPHTPGSPSRLHSRLFTASMAFTLISGARHSLFPPEGRPLTTPQASLHATDRSVAPPNGAFDAGLRPVPFPDRAASLLPGLLAATRTGLPPAGDDELAAVGSPHGSPPSVLGARNGTR